jgi:hypothetical protein
MAKLTPLEEVTWRSPPRATFGAMAAEIEARFGPPSARGLDSSGLGPFDAHLLRCPCGLELSLWRYHLGPQLEPIDAAVAACSYEIYSSEPADLAHLAFHLEVPVEQLSPTGAAAGAAPGERVAAAFRVMRTDDNGNDVEVTRATSRCEAEALVEQYERRGHKQSYWIAEVDRGEERRPP